jgi:hypothetical protein
MTTGKIADWVIILTGYYAVVMVKMCLWIHRNGGLANPNRDVHILTLVMLRVATIHAAILLSLMVVVNLRRQRMNAAAFEKHHDAATSELLEQAVANDG